MSEDIEALAIEALSPEEALNWDATSRESRLASEVLRLRAHVRNVMQIAIEMRNGESCNPPSECFGRLASYLGEALSGDPDPKKKP